MRLNEFDFETVKPGDTKDIGGKFPDLSNVAIKFITAHCQVALNTYKSVGKILYRGVKQSNYSISADLSAYMKRRDIISPKSTTPTPPLFIGKPWLDRKPKCSGSNRYVDKQLAAQGFQARRGNSILTTSGLSDTKSFGAPYGIFPVDGFYFTFSPNIYDWNYLDWDQKSIPATEETGAEFIERTGFTKNNFADAVASRNEIYINGTYLAISLEYNSQTMFNKVMIHFGL